MAWVDIPEKDFKEYWKYMGSKQDAWNGISEETYVTLQYNDSTVTPEKVEVRFKFNNIHNTKPGDNYDYYDTYYIILNPTSASRVLVPLKTKYTNPAATQYGNYAKPAWPYYSNAENVIPRGTEGLTGTFTLKKKYSDETFTFPLFWFCNDGSGHGESANPDGSYDIDRFYRLYNDNTKDRPADEKYERYNLRSTHGAQAISIATTVTVATAGSSPTLTVSDVGNNTVKFVGALGKNGTNNKIKSATLYYTLNGDDPSKSDSTRTKISLGNTSGDSYSKTISITKACTVKAFIECIFEHNTTSTSGSVAAKYYIKPGNPGKPYLTDASFRNGRLTVKQDWGWQWSLAKAGNTAEYNAVKGYRIRFFVKRKGSSNFVNTRIIDYYDKKTIKSSELSANDWVYDRTSTSYPMPMAAADPEQDIKPGDFIKLSIQAYSVNGVSTKLLSSEITSDEYEIKNAGIVHVKVSGAWKEGQVYVKVNNAWQEAETVNVKVNGAWQESQ